MRQFDKGDVARGIRTGITFIQLMPDNPADGDSGTLGSTARRDSHVPLSGGTAMSSSKHPVGREEGPGASEAIGGV